MNTEQLEKQLWIINNETIPRLTKRVNELEAEVTALQEFSVLMTADKIRSESAQTPPAPTPQIFRCPDCSGRVLGSAPCQRCNTAAQTPAPTLKEMKAQEPNMINAIMSDIPTPTVSLTDLVNYREALVREIKRYVDKAYEKGEEKDIAWVDALERARDMLDNVFPDLARGGK